MVNLLTNRAGAIAAAAIALCSLWAAAASATTFVYKETGSSVPGLLISASITIDGGFSNLPTIDNTYPPPPAGYDFGALTAFSITVPVGGDQATYTLADFTAQCDFSCPIAAFPQWSISPGGIGFINSIDRTDFYIIGFDPVSQIEFESDAPTQPPDCEQTAVCIATGVWAAVPEASSAALLLTALLGLAPPTASARRRRRRAGRSAATPQ